MGTEFTQLRRLSSVIEGFREKSFELLDLEHGRGGHSYRLFRAYLDQNLTEEAAVASVAMRRDAAEKRYLIERLRLKKKLMNMLFHLDLKRRNQSEYAQALYATDKMVFQARVLLRLGMTALAEKIARDAFESASKFEITINCIALLSILRSQAGARGDSRALIRYDEQEEAMISCYRNERRSSRLSNELQAYYASHASNSGPITPRAQASFEEIESLFKTTPRFVIGYEYYRIKRVALQAENRHREAYIVCVEALAFIDEHPLFLTRSRLAEFTTAKAECAFLSMDLDAADQAIRESEPFYSQQNFNWFTFQLLKLQIAMHRHALTEAKAMLLEAESHPAYEALDAGSRDVWKLHKFYLSFVSNEFSTHAERQEALDELRQYRSHSEQLSKDKNGYNFAILLLESLILFELKDGKSLTERADALRKYRNRYLTGNQDARILAKYFLKAIEYVLEADPNPKMLEALRKKTEADLKALGAILATQPVPYLWILERLHNSALSWFDGQA